MELEYKESEFEALPVGAYSAIYQGCEDFDGDAQFGPAVRLKFVCVGGDVDGRETDVLASKRLTSKSKLAKFVTALAGRPLTRGEKVDLDSFKGVNVLIVVTPKEKGEGTTITSIVKK